MEFAEKEAFEFTIEELDRELIARGAHMPRKVWFAAAIDMDIPQLKIFQSDVDTFYKHKAQSLTPDDSLSHISTEELVKVLLFKTGQLEMGGVRCARNVDERIDVCDIVDMEVERNAHSVVGICVDNDILDIRGDARELRLGNYGKTFNLCGKEPFYHQPIASRGMRTGILVKEDIVATAYHAVDKDLERLRFVFGFHMQSPDKWTTGVPEENIYTAREIITFSCATRSIEYGEDWALVKLDRPVKNRPPATLSKKDTELGQNIYILGHPRGLPLKFAPGARIRKINSTTFNTDIDVYSGNSGSPVFDANSHQLIGIVGQGDHMDFRFTGKCWVSILYQKKDKEINAPVCTKLSQFSHYL